MSKSDLTTNEETGDNFSTASMQDSILEIQNDAVSQQALLMNLKKKKIDLENDIRHKWQELNHAREEQRLLEVELNSHQMHLADVEELQAMSQQKMTHTRQEVEEVRQQLANEKEEQLKILKHYEMKMASLSKKIMSGPILYDKKNLAKEIALLHDERASIHVELTGLEQELDEMKSRFLQLINHDQYFECFPRETGMPSTLKFIVTQMEEDISSCDSDVQNLHEELKNLEVVSTGLQDELGQLRNK